MACMGLWRGDRSKARCCRWTVTAMHSEACSAKTVQPSSSYADEGTSESCVSTAPTHSCGEPFRQFTDSQDIPNPRNATEHERA